MSWVLIVWVSFPHSRSLTVHEFRTEEQCRFIAQRLEEKYGGWQTTVETECVRLPREGGE